MVLRAGSVSMVDWAFSRSSRYSPPPSSTYVPWVSVCGGHRLWWWGSEWPSAVLTSTDACNTMRMADKAIPTRDRIWRPRLRSSHLLSPFFGVLTDSFADLAIPRQARSGGLYRIWVIGQPLAGPDRKQTRAARDRVEGQARWAIEPNVASQAYSLHSPAQAEYPGKQTLQTCRS